MATSPETEALISRLRFRHLRLMVELQRGGSLRAAAQALNLTQPALSKALSEIESAFGFDLFTRTARGLKPTVRGQVAIRGATLMLEELGRVQAESAAGDLFTACLKIGATPFVAQGYLPEALQKIARRDPPVRVQLLEQRVPALMEALAKGEVDALLTTYPLQLPEPGSPALHYENLFEVQFTVIVRKGHPLSKARDVDWHRLSLEPWVMPGRSSMARRVIEDCFLRAGVVPPTPIIESDSPVTNFQLVAAGAGLGIAPDIVLMRHAKDAASVRALHVSPRIPSGPVALIYRAGVHNERVTIFREALGLA